MMPTNQTLTPIRPLGEGGFGTTTLVERDGKRYVLKRLKQAAIAAHGQTAIELFVKESQYLDALGDHPQIPSLIDSGIDEEGPWLLQEYILGENLETILSQQNSFSEAETILMMKSILPILKTVHESGTIHRDVKPANIIFSEDKYFLVDFGASKQVSETVLAKTGTTIGSVGYAAPEQVFGKAGYSSDIFSLGVTCIHLLTGMQPIDMMDRVNAGQWCWRDFLPKDRTISEGLGLILDKMLEYGIQRRYKSAEQVLEAISKIDRRAIARQRLARIKKNHAIDLAKLFIFSAFSVALVGGGFYGLFFGASWVLQAITGVFQAFPEIVLTPESPQKSMGIVLFGLTLAKTTTFIMCLIGGVASLIKMINKEEDPFLHMIFPVFLLIVTHLLPTALGVQ